MHKLWGLAALIAACDAQVDADYGGEPLVTLSGALLAPGAAAVRSMVVRWSTPDPRGPGEHASPTTLRTSFPNGFEAELVAEPPPGARSTLADGEPGFAEGYLFALDGEGRTRGTDTRRVVVWLDGDAAAASATAAYLGGPLPAGYHVVWRSELPAPPAAQRPLIARCVEEALAAGWAEARAETACSAQRAYRLFPSPLDGAEGWTVHVVEAP